MALVINNRVRETTSTTGTGAVTLGGAVAGFQTFGAGIGNSNTTYYAISINSESEWEVGLGTLNGDSSTLTRTTVLESSNSDSAVDFSAGSKEVFCTLPSEKAVYLDASGAAVGAIANVVEDTTPQLGGNLDVNGNAIVSASNGAIAINANGTGMVTMTSNSITGDVIPGKLSGTNFPNSLLIGHSTTGTLDDAQRNTGVGIGSLDALTSGDRNTAVGYNSGTAMTTALYNTFVGDSAGATNGTGANNTAIGMSSLGANSGGHRNTAVGYSAGNAMTGHDGTAIGNEALNLATGAGNTAVGKDAGKIIEGGEYNICLGYQAGDNISSGSGNVVIGKADVSSATGDDQLSISDGEDGAVVWVTGESTGNVEINEVWNPSLSTTGKALIMGF
jgi:hypothetical protein